MDGRKHNHTAAPGFLTAATPRPDQARVRRLAKKKAMSLTSPDLEIKSPEETRRMLHELQVHQIDLEMQNEELRAAQAELDAARARYFDLYDLAPVGYCTISEKGLIQEANHTAAVLLGVERQSMINRALARFILKEDQDIYCRHLKKLFITGERQICEFRMLRSSHHLLWVRMEAIAAENPGGVSVCRLVLSEITDCNRATQELQKTSEQLRFETLLTELSACFINVPADQVNAVIEHAQRRVCECLGLDLSALWQWEADSPGNLMLTHLYRPLGGSPVSERMDASAYFPWCVRKLAAGEIVAVSSMGDVPVEAALDVKTWRHFGIKTTLTIPLSAGGGQPFGAISFNDLKKERQWAEPLVKRLELVAQVFANAIVRKRYEQALRESEEQVRMALDAAGAGAWNMDVESKRVWVSDRELDMFGFSADEPITYDSFQHVIHPDDRECVRMAIEKSLRTRVQFVVEYRIVRPDGSVRWISARGQPGSSAKAEPVRLTGIALDITERKQNEFESRRSQAEIAHLSRAAMLGELSGSLAHELNQPLTAILSNAQAAQRFLADEPPDLNEVRDILQDIVQDDQRAGEVIRRLRLLLKKGEVKHEPLVLNEVVQDVLRLISNDLISHNVAIRTTFAPGLPVIKGDRVQLQQVLLNLIMNATDAMAACPSVDRQLLVCTEAGGQQDVRVSVTDSGTGIASEIANKLFGPFVTTKPSGLGLGLKVCHTILTAHGGRIEGKNNPGRGATFSFTLPAAKGRAP